MRPHSAPCARWSEFDLDARVWTIPAERMKMRREHRIPLAKAFLAILIELCPGAPNSLVFASERSRAKPMSENTQNIALRRLGYSKTEMTSHGFRSSASTLLNESGLRSADAIERQLSHVEANDIRRAYARGEH